MLKLWRWLNEPDLESGPRLTHWCKSCKHNWTSPTMEVELPFACPSCGADKLIDAMYSSYVPHMDKQYYKKGWPFFRWRGFWTGDYSLWLDEKGIWRSAEPTKTFKTSQAVHSPSTPSYMSGEFTTTVRTSGYYSFELNGVIHEHSPIPRDEYVRQQQKAAQDSWII